MYDLTHEPTRCPRCKSRDIDVGRMPDDDWYDFELATACGVPEHDFDERFLYTQEHMECDNCGLWQAYGPRLYWHEDSGTYEVARPLTPDEQVKADAELARKQAEEAGQLSLFSDE